MRVALALALAVAVILAQVFYGGMMRLVFGLPAYAVIGAAGVLGVALVGWRRAVAPNPVAVSITVVAAGYFLWRSLVSPGFEAQTFYTFLVLGCLTAYLLAAGVLTTPPARYTFVAVLLAAAAVQVTVAAMQFGPSRGFWPLPWFSEQMYQWYGPNARSSRGQGLFLNANQLAWFLNAVALMCAALAVFGRCRAWAKIVFAYFSAVCVAGVLLSGSRGGALALGCGLAAFAALGLLAVALGAPGRRVVLGALALAVVGVSLAGGVWLFQRSDIVQSRLERIATDNYRLRVWPTTLRQMQTEPVLGTGAGSFTHQARRLSDYLSSSNDIYAHNDWAQALGDFGFSGFVLLVAAFLAGIVAGFRELIRVLRERMAVSSRPQSNAAAFLIAALSTGVAFGVHSIFDYNMQIPANAMLAGVVFGFLANSGAPGSGRRRVAAATRIGTGVLCGLAGGGLLWLCWVHHRVEPLVLHAENSLLLADPDAAIAQASQALELSPEHPRATRLLGDAYLKLSFSGPLRARNRLAAISSLRRAAELDPTERWNHFLAALALEGATDPEEARVAYVEAIRLDPSSPVLREYYGLFLENTGRESEAIRAYEVALRIPGTRFARQRLQHLLEKARSEDTIKNSR